MWCSGGSLVGMRKPALGRIIRAQHFRQALGRCFSSSTLGLAVEILHKYPSHAVLRLAFDGKTIVPFGPRGNEISGAGDSKPWSASSQKENHTQERRERSLRSHHVVAVPAFVVEQAIDLLEQTTTLSIIEMSGRKCCRFHLEGGTGVKQSLGKGRLIWRLWCWKSGGRGFDEYLGCCLPALGGGVTGWQRQGPQERPRIIGLSPTGRSNIELDHAKSLRASSVIQDSKMVFFRDLAASTHSHKSASRPGICSIRKTSMSSATDT